MEEAAASTFYPIVQEERFFRNDGNLLEYYSKKIHTTPPHIPTEWGPHILTFLYHPLHHLHSLACQHV